MTTDFKSRAIEVAQKNATVILSADYLKSAKEADKEMIIFFGSTEGKSKLNLVLLKERTSTSDAIYGINYDLLTIDGLQEEKND